MHVYLCSLWNRHLPTTVVLSPSSPKKTLDYSIAVYPLVLIIITCVLFKLYECGYRPITFTVEVDIICIYRRIYLHCLCFSSQLQHTGSRMICLLASLLIVITVSSSTNGSCPTWFHYSTGDCTCGDELDGTVSCDNTSKTVRVLDCFCMTSNGDGDNTTVVGRCLFNCVNQTRYMKDKIFHPVTSNLSELDRSTCGYLHRRGRLCGKCEPDHYIPVYSYTFECKKCFSVNSWAQYLSVAFIPLTIFYIVVLLFQLSANSPQLTGFVLFAQYMSIPANSRIILQTLNSINCTAILYIAKAFFTMYGIWNLDFFRTVLPPICLKVTTLQALALDYTIAVYPLVLIVMTCVLFTLHDRGYRPITLLWRPFNKFFAGFTRQWNFKTSIIDVFATFILLSYVKLLSVSFDLLIPTRVFNSDGLSEGFYLYYDASIMFFGEEHLPYACLALFVLIVWIIFPLFLLLLYPMLCFQRCLNFCRLNSLVLRVFMECFQGYYQDRTDRGKEYRYFAALHLAVRLLAFVLYALTLSASFYTMFTLVLIIAGVIVAFFQPYKQMFSLYNKVDAGAFFLMALWCNSIVTSVVAGEKDHRYVYVGAVVTTLCTLLPLLYIIVITLNWIFSRKNVIKVWIRNLRWRTTEEPALEQLLPRDVHQR